MAISPIVVTVVLTALVFDFTNGFHDNWRTLLLAALVTVTIVVLVASAIVGLSARTSGAARSGPGTAVAAICLLATALIAGYGIVLVIG